MADLEVRVGKRCYVGNLSYRVAWQDLKDKFRECGNVVYANVTTSSNGSSKGWGIVEYETPEEAVAAIETLNGQLFMERPLLVREDREDRDLKEPNSVPESRPAPRSQRAGTSSGFQVVVQGLPFKFTNEDLLNEFNIEGDVDHAEIATSGGRSKGFGVVRFGTTEGAQRAIQKFHGFKLEGRTLSVFLDRFA